MIVWYPLNKSLTGTWGAGREIQGGLSTWTEARENDLAESVTRLSKAKARAAYSSLARTQISGLVAGGLVFCILLTIYFSALFAKRAFLGLGEGRMFRTFVVGNSKVYGTKSTMENIYSLYKGRGNSYWTGYEYTGQMMLTDERGE